jgi:hypothetical protein
MVSILTSLTTTGVSTMDYILIKRNEINTAQPELFGHCDAESVEYAIVNPAWNTRLTHLLDTEELVESEGLRKFTDLMIQRLNCAEVEDLRYCEERKTYLITAYYNLGGSSWNL